MAGGDGSGAWPCAGVIGKQRHGPIGSVALAFEARRPRLANAVQDSQQDAQWVDKEHALRQWFYILLPLGVADRADLTTAPATWLAQSTTLIGVVAIFAAGLLIRLAQGAPNTSRENLTSDETRQRAAAIEQSGCSQRIVLALCALTILCLACADTLGRAAPLIMAFALAFTLMQLWKVTGGDVRMIDLHRHLAQEVRQVAADAFERHVIVPTRPGRPIARPLIMGV